ncbi:MAG: DegV family EDD domain-containing protein [Ruminiclostridium sp.]|nr:DegV family EDD domain-containing protein [Ruminiclostridium sp.]
MTPKKLRDFIFDNDRDLHERLFVLLMLVTIIAWCITLVELIFTGATIGDMIALIVGIIMFSAATMLSVRFNRVSAGAVVISAGMSFLYLPMTFFFGGGIFGDAPLWYLFGIFFINMCLTGKPKIVFLIANGVLAAGFWYISYAFPEMIVQNNNAMAHIFSFIALVLISISVSITLTFRTYLYNREVKRSEDQKREIEKLNEAQNRFFSSMSHEIRTPINTIIGLNEMILRENISDEVAEDAANIQAASNMLLHLINDILDMSKLASGQMELTPVTYHPGDMLSEIVGMLWIRAKSKNLEFHVSIAPDIPAELVGDEMRIKQILINVLNNAIKYTKEGSVSLSIQSGGIKDGAMNVIYTVSDTGIGIKKENIPFLFTAFRRVDEEKNRHIEGTGLGLSIVKQFVDLMNGRITVNSVYTKGSTFVIEIPQKISGNQLIGEVDLSSKTTVNRQRSRGARFTAPEARILVVDDNASNLLVVSKLLRETGIKTDTVTSGSEALKKTLNNYYHIILMDHLMPEMDGIECFRAIRTQTGGQCKESKIVALTANAGAESRLLYEKVGFDGYLIKPVTGIELEREIYRLLPSNLTYVSGESDDILRETISWMNTKQRKKAVAITTESVADLPQELIDKYGIAVLPHLVCTAEGNFKDGIEIETKGLLNYMQDISRKVTTRAPDVRTVENFFAKQLSGANNIIHISISGKLTNSGCLVANEAARAFDNVTVIDTGHLSSGQGLVVLEACRLAAEGRSPEEIVSRIEAYKTKVHTSFIVDNLDFLARAEQVSDRLANITKSVMARPVLMLKKGKMGVRKIYFGARENAWKNYIRSVLNNPSGVDNRILFVTYVGLTQREKEWIREQIVSIADFDEIYFQKASPVIAVNCGVGTFGLLICDKTGSKT